MTLVCKSSALGQIHSPQQKLFYSFDWLHFKGPWRQQPQAVNHVWTLLMNYLSKQSLKRVLRQSCVLQLKWIWTVTEESPLLRLQSVCRYISEMALLTPCSEILWYSHFRSILAHWMPGFYCLKRGQYFPLTIQSWRLRGKAFPWQRQNILFCLTEGPDLNICDLLSWLRF